MIHKHELIGFEIEVVHAKNKANVGIKGIVVDETKSTFVLETSRGLKRVLKNTIEFVVVRHGKRYRLSGAAVAKRPHERLR